MLKVAIGALGGVALIVGGVGVLTIMTTALRERTQEIGLLRAVGCTRSQVMWMFLGEAVLLSAMGGLHGQTRHKSIQADHECRHHGQSE